MEAINSTTDLNLLKEAVEIYKEEIIKKISLEGEDRIIKKYKKILNELSKDIQEISFYNQEQALRYYLKYTEDIYNIDLDNSYYNVSYYTKGRLEKMYKEIIEEYEDLLNEAKK